MNRYDKFHYKRLVSTEYTNGHLVMIVGLLSDTLLCADLYHCMLPALKVFNFAEMFW